MLVAQVLAVIIFIAMFLMIVMDKVERQMFKSQNKFVIEAVNDYYDRCIAVGNDPYLETREKEDAFTERIVNAVEKKVMSNLPALFGMYMAQMQLFSLSVPMGAYQAAQGGMMYGQESLNGALQRGDDADNPLSEPDGRERVQCDGEGIRGADR